MAPPEPAADSREMEANSSEEFILRLDGPLNEEEMSHWQPRTAYQPDNLVDSAMADNEPLFPPHKCKGKTHIWTCLSSVPLLTILTLINSHIAIFFPEYGTRHFNDPKLCILMCFLLMPPKWALKNAQLIARGRFLAERRDLNLGGRFLCALFHTVGQTCSVRKTEAGLLCSLYLMGSHSVIRDMLPEWRVTKEWVLLFFIFFNLLLHFFGSFQSVLRV